MPKIIVLCQNYNICPDRTCKHFEPHEVKDNCGNACGRGEKAIIESPCTETTFKKYQRKLKLEKLSNAKNI